MALNRALLPEFDREMAKTRIALERIPDDKLGWKPHEKSMTFAVLCGHLAQIPDWSVKAIGTDSVDIAPPGAPPYTPWVPASRDEILGAFDKNVAAARAAIARANDEHLMQNWTLERGAQPMFSMPRIAVLRGMVMNHMIHHRGQLTVFMRLCDIPVPSIYGPSADDSSF